MNRLETLTRDLPPLPERLLIGLSGGADSVALFHMLLARDHGAGRLWAVHVNHGLRGEQSDEDERFVRSLCQEYKVPLKVYRACPPDNPGEEWAREARYAYFRQAMEETGAEALALAHHRDDQAETLLIHLLRGAGLTGLAGMPPEGTAMGIRVVRPLLAVPRRELRLALEEAGYPWREDDSNQDERYLRNAVRHELLPLMERLSGGCTSRIAAAASLLRADEAVLSGEAEAFLNGCGGSSYLPLKELIRLPQGMSRRVLRLWWERYAGASMEERTLSLSQTESLEALMTAPAGSRCNLPGDCHGQRGWTHLHLTGRQETDDTAWPGLRWMVSETVDGPGDGRRRQAMPEALWRSCQVRTRQPGDWICPYGQRGRQSMQDYFVNRKVDAPFRGRIPLVCRGSEVLLAAGVGAGDIPPMENHRGYVMLRWEGEMPWERVKG